MNRTHRFAFSTAALGILAALAAPAAAEVIRYNVNANSTYKYLPSGMGPGIPGGVPSAYELDFGVSGQFSINYTTSQSAPNLAAFIDIDLVLTGNEAIQANPPSFGVVTAERLATWLGNRFLQNVPSVGMFQAYEDLQFPNFEIHDWTQFIEVVGGYNATFVDGDGLTFDVTATPVPEPTMGMLACASAAALAAVCRRRVTRWTRSTCAGRFAR